MLRKTIKVRVNNFRKFDDPLGSDASRKYIFYAKACDVPDGILMATNAIRNTILLWQVNPEKGKLA